MQEHGFGFQLDVKNNEVSISDYKEIKLSEKINMSKVKDVIIRIDENQLSVVCIIDISK